MVRLQKYLAGLGIGSRRHCEELIGAGRVSVDGEVAQLGAKVDPKKNRVCLDGCCLNDYASERPVYIMLYKPAGYVTTAQDEYDRATVLDLLRDIPERVVPVGRLDRDTEGLLLLTNDGDLTYHLTHPRFGVEKEYVAKVKGKLTPAGIEALQRGVRLEDGLTAPAEVEVLPNGLVRMVIHEGRKRQVKRMLDAVGCPVLALRRTRVGDLSLRGLQRGHYRELTDEEVASLYRLSRTAGEG